jgi:hypothetical protein
MVALIGALIYMSHLLEGVYRLRLEKPSLK